MRFFFFFFFFNDTATTEIYTLSLHDALPIVDRLTILCGVAVCWHFSLLPRWALAVLAVREVVTALLAEIVLRRGGELQINWLGRIAVTPVMAAIFFAMVSASWVWSAMLIVGVVLGVLGTIAYVRTGLRELATA